ncbi:hypothetical protein I79_005178 [Cricetulus griseus]|uniref:Uncharacterized protein n=1 Tax=Cricetulus griseus TaxID=10029 RepID=G3H4H7_CRIGR|nr:hypothetical protein I79_005178 [Cricetulus griseus]
MVCVYYRRIGLSFTVWILGGLDLTPTVRLSLSAFTHGVISVWVTHLFHCVLPEGDGLWGVRALSQVFRTILDLGVFPDLGNIVIL